MRYCSIAFGLLFTATFAQAQSAGWQPPVPDTAKVNLSPLMASRLSYLTGACPVGLGAERRGTVNLVIVDGTERREVVPTVRLTVANLQGKDIVGATVTVRGYDTNPRLAPLRSGQAVPTPELAKTLVLKLNVASGKNGETDLTMQRFGSVSGVDLESLEYADGTSWHAPAERVCHVEPSLMMLVGSR